MRGMVGCLKCSGRSKRWIWFGLRSIRVSDGWPDGLQCHRRMSDASTGGVRSITPPVAPH